MSQPTEGIVFEHKGIGTALSQRRLTVPLNQREYSWEEEHVSDLFNDFKSAIANNRSTYFLGTVVLTRGSNGIPEVTDGQQRLATTTILIAAIRDYLLETGNVRKAESIENDFLLTIDYDTEETVPRLRLNVDDNDYFLKRVISRPTSPDRSVATKRTSHELIDQAATLAAAHVRSVANYYGQASIEQLTVWRRFLENNALIILVTVPDDLDAFRMFETLNDRGLKASQADLLKNHILSLSGDRKEEAQQK